MRFTTINSSSAALDELLGFAAAYDAQQMFLDESELEALLASLVNCGMAVLGRGSEIRYGSTRVKRDAAGAVSVYLKYRNVIFTNAGNSHSAAA